jgi:hypothetical protein
MVAAFLVLSFRLVVPAFWVLLVEMATVARALSPMLLVLLLGSASMMGVNLFVTLFRFLLLLFLFRLLLLLCLQRRLYLVSPIVFLVSCLAPTVLRIRLRPFPFAVVPATMASCCRLRSFRFGWTVSP